MINITEMLSKYQKKSNATFNDVLEKFCCLDREMLIQEIAEDSGFIASQFIHFWNAKDDEDHIPISERKPIKIYFDSPGGSLTQTFSIIDSIALSKTPVWTFCISCAYSGGFFAFIAGHKRFAYPHASFLYHEGAVGTGGDAGKFRNFSAFYETQLKLLKEHTLKYTKITPEQYEEHIKDDWWLTAEQALELGVCDEIITELK